ncbi:hypothetical protein EAS64_30215 [Trebonia kvetii]|uniref:Glycoprotein n=1 Tax=Trebonia kvetii TaxID=2480626 RepID=A0A6P2BRN2_9ACTN|nr:DUF6049 family protein [Trebonia kvetii]TVZ01739.1 hypothetical protein EAS64_30215 [Trebonia kvetii]
MRSVVRALGTLIAVLLVAVGPVLAVPAARASAAAEVEQRSSGTVAASSHTLAISITGMTPRTATQNSTVTLRGTLANHTGSAVSGVTVQANTSTSVFNTRAEMAAFADSDAYPYLIQAAGLPETIASVPSGATVSWSVSFDAGVYYDHFGVFPVRVSAATADGRYRETARTFVPFWPSDKTQQPAGLQVAWIWPLTDTPQQGACLNTLTTSELAGSVSAGGRLSTLLDAGAAWAQKDNLTWSIDPALLSDVSVMTRGYHTFGGADCTGRSAEKPSKDAADWLLQLQRTTAGQPAFLTSYANVDVAALSHAGMDANIRSAYQVGRTVAGQILPHTFGPKGTGTGDGAVLRAASPADGLADRGVLTSLANDAGINTLVLASGEAHARPSADGWDDALSRTTSDTGKSVPVLLADSRLTTLLGTASSSASAAKQFALIQDFLAQTAMIMNEGPSLARTLVVAPPAGWDPSPAEANGLLSVTREPWLHAVSLHALAGQAAHVPSRPLKAKQVSGAELSASYLDQVRTVGNSASLFKNLLYQPTVPMTNRLAAAVAATASSAWRGAGEPAGALATTMLSGYLADSENKVKIITSQKVLLAGTTGEAPVSVLNGLTWPVQVRVVATAPEGSQLEVGSLSKPLNVPPHQTGTVRLALHSGTIGTTTVQLQLVTQNGSPLGTARPLSVEVTRFGRSLLIIIGAALGILVLTSAYRLRRKRNAAGGHRGSPDDTANAGGAG